jgi:hypothetical protein
MTHAFAASSVALVSLTASLSALAEPTPAPSGQNAASDQSVGQLSVPALERTAPSGSAPDSGPPLLFGRDLHVGGYGGIDVMYTRMFGRDGAVVGLQGAVLINHRLAFGLAGYGFTNPETGPDDLQGDAQYFETGYGGLTVRYSLMSDALPVYATIGGLVGAGAIELSDRHRDEDLDLGDDRADDVFAVFQPDVTLHANVTRWMRFGATAGYRFTSGVNHLGFEESDVNGVVIGGHVQFGSF